jgi:plastocyanin
LAADSGRAGLVISGSVRYVCGYCSHDVSAMRVLISVIVLGLLIGAAIAAELEVRQFDRTFLPERLNITRGSVVRFANDEQFTHHAFVDTPQFKADTGDIPAGQSREITFSQAGTFVVRCAIHPQMKMTMVVSEQ